jgi:glycosyltransferase involved in cell wall biosynthesis
LIDFLFKYSIDLVHVEHFALQSIGWTKYLDLLGIPLIVGNHDYYTICPSLNLLDENMVSCGGICTKGRGNCNAVFFPIDSMPPLKNNFVHGWQDQFREVYSHAYATVFPSERSNRVFSSVYNKLGFESVVIPHGRDWGEFGVTDQFDLNKDPLRVLIPGTLGTNKGIQMLMSITKHFKGRKDVEFHTLGQPAFELRGLVKNHGKYLRQDFGKKVEKISPHIALMTSISEETYSLILDECWAQGLPVVALGIGAIKERVQKYLGGWLVNISDGADGVIKLIEHLVRSDDVVRDMQDSIRGLPQRYLGENSIERMVNKYTLLYLEAISVTMKSGLAKNH